MTVRDVFAKQLMSVRGCSASRAATILEHYPTAPALVTALCEAGDRSAADKLLADFCAEDSNKRFGPAFAKAIASAFLD